MTSTERERITVVALDDHPLLIEGIVAVFSRLSSSEATWLGVAGTLEDFSLMLSDLADDAVPDVALIDLNLPDASSAGDAVGIAVERGIRCVVVTAEARSVPIRQAIQAGAQAVYLKHEPVEHFTDVIHRVLRGEHLVSSPVASALLEDPSVVADITPRELEIMRLIADGVPRKLVGKFIEGDGIAESTVTTHLQNVLAKYRDRGRAQGNTIELIRELRRDGHLPAN